MSRSPPSSSPTPSPTWPPTMVPVTALRPPSKPICKVSLILYPNLVPFNMSLCIWMLLMVAGLAGAGAILAVLEMNVTAGSACMDTANVTLTRVDRICRNSSASSRMCSTLLVRRVLVRYVASPVTPLTTNLSAIQKTKTSATSRANGTSHGTKSATWTSSTRSSKRTT